MLKQAATAVLALTALVLIMVVGTVVVSVVAPRMASDMTYKWQAQP